MNQFGATISISPRDYDAVLFDLDGVLTKTASVHAAAWKRLFDDFLRQRATGTGEPFVPFDAQEDYRRYVDGKARYDGVRDFLASRGVELPFAAPAGDPEAPNVQALGRLKDRYFREHLERHGVEAYEASVTLVRTLRAQEVRTAVVSSSKNCTAVLEAAGIAQLFDAQVDGNDIDRLGLGGKPAPDSFLEGARRLNVEAARAIVVEDAIAGVEAGCAGCFGMVIGVDRLGQSQALRKAGALAVVTSLAQVRVAEEPPSAWLLTYEGFDPAQEGVREAICALGNGYFTTRGTAPWARSDGTHYPGTYLAGGYNRLTTDIAGRTIENESLVNFPNWLPLGFRIGDGDWFDLKRVTILSYRQELDLRRAMLLRTVRFEDGQGRRSTLVERRLVSMADMHLAAVELRLIAENWSGPVTVRSAIDGRVVNSGAKLYLKFKDRHLEPLSGEAVDDEGICLLVRTCQSNLHVVQAARTQAFVDGERCGGPRRLVEEPGYIGQEFEITLEQGRTLALEKLCFLYTSRDQAISECATAARTAMARATTFEGAMAAHTLVWKNLWRRFDVHIVPAGGFHLNAMMLLRLNMVHLLQAVSPHSIGLDIGVPARGWTGEAYEGHIFWDELFIFPFLNYRMPEITRSLLMYRYRRLGEARAAARNAGFEGAMFPWQSGSDGQEETQDVNLNPRSLRWVPDNSYLQRHVGCAVAWNVWQYFQVTRDVEFLQFHGAELILEIARFWSSMATFNDQRERYEIHGVMGPDEFHESYPGAEKPGLANNAYTNLMVVWVLWRALDVIEFLPDIRRVELAARLALTPQEIARWEDISRRMFVPFHDDCIISQFEGYERLAELDWEGYRQRYGNIQRLDLILEAEGDSPNRYKLSKQPDVLMLFYLFSSEELGALFDRLGYPYDPGIIRRNVDYYNHRSSHGSTLSRVVHAWVLARSNRQQSLQFYAEALQSDVSDIQQGTTAEGVHLGAMAGTVDLVQRATTGIEVTGEVLRLNPQLPPELERLDMRIRYRGQSLDLRLMHDTITLRARETRMPPIRVCVRDETVELTGGSTRTFPLR
ncbi:beta-phosphoglucomutase family hydrolase [Geobacter sp. SVR]|uniref:beta-phosphoglucomutase family hydrolase n=1 Tax=Geobacter sp. SVR TaxID=2495594 RepID=UPI00143EF5C6|nr:beta-phosphoglucomutase family hydrolase [Geobacter sp. SVR]BCS52890.1 beta-phosphoglucomutase [Geobacter sp. SVR]GCF87512.1 beta-phosphoglucomutase [Geobacter sp. SVR]